MRGEYLVDKNSKTLIFTGNPQSIKNDSIRLADTPAFTSVVIPNSVASIGEYAFAHCLAVDSIHIPNAVKIFDTWVFYGCHSLASIHIANSIHRIDNSAFSNCSSLASIHIPNSVVSIGARAFSHCTALHKSFLHSSLKQMTPTGRHSPFPKHTSLIRPRLKPISSLKKKSACRASKANYSIYL